MFRLSRKLSRLLGQPSNYSHPTLVAPDHVTSLISKSELHQRRRTLMNKMINFKNENPALEPLSEMHGKERMEHVLILSGASKQRMSNDINFDFHQYTNFNYLTGFIEEDAVLIMETIPNKPHPQFKSILFVQPYQGADAQMWTGFRTGPKDAVDLTGIGWGKNVCFRNTILLPRFNDKKSSLT